jgi:hypothetical protein
MRILDIIQLNEFAPPTGRGANDLQLLINIIEMVPSQDPLYAVAKNIMQNLLKDVEEPAPTQQAPVQQAPVQQAPVQQAPVQQAQPTPVPPPVPAPVAQQPVAPEAEQPLAEEVQPGDESWYEAFVDAKNNPKLAARMLHRLRTEPDYREEMRYVHKNGEKKIKASFTAGGTEALTTVSKFFEDVKTSADLLAGKAVGVLAQLKIWYALEAKRQKVAGQPPMQMPRPKVTTNALYQKLLYPLENIFHDLGFRDNPPNLRNFKKEAPKILKFMSLCEDGIIEFEDLLSAGGGNVRDLITDADSRYIYDKIFDKLLALDAGQGGGAWGPAELGLAILCKPVNKAQGKGDLATTVNGQPVGVEVKASRVADSGGRLGGKGVLPGKSGKTDFLKALKDICDTAGVDIKDIGKTYLDVVKKKTVNGVKTNVVVGQKPGRSILPTSMSSSNWFTSFNNLVVPALNANKSLRPRVVVGDFLVAAVRAVVSPDGQPYVKDSLIRQIPDINGNISYERFKKIITRQWYDIYAKVDDIGIILVINPTNGNYSIVNSGQMLTSKDCPITISGGLDFNDAQGKAGPQIGIA